jgi:hypothetical protein
MIVSNSRKFIYLRVPRTASTSLANFLVANIAFDSAQDYHTPIPYNRVAGLNISDAQQVHANLDDIVGLGLLRHPVSEYAVFGVIREPLDRFISGAWHTCHYDNRAPRDNNEAVAYALALTAPVPPVLRPQVNWLLHDGRPINRIFPYHQLDELAQAVLGIADARVTFRHRAESRRTRDMTLDAGLRAAVLARYAADVELYRSVTGLPAASK